MQFLIGPFRELYLKNCNVKDCVLASGIAKKFGISELIIGLTIVAMGTSAPEAAVSIAAAAKGSAGISIGNVIGSNIMNIFIILGVVAAIVPLKIERSTVRYEMPSRCLLPSLSPQYSC